ncbi:hypothetical protein ABTL31_19455, partial [Acinetobacter baumannii]
ICRAEAAAAGHEARAARTSTGDHAGSATMALPGACGSQQLHAKICATAGRARQKAHRRRQK